jgi:hypothetical protein
MKLRRWVWVPLFAPSFKKVWNRPRSTLEKKIIGAYIGFNIFFLNIGLRPKLGNTYYHINNDKRNLLINADKPEV